VPLIVVIVVEMEMEMVIGGEDGDRNGDGDI
jgi:hypothetical protein